MKNKRLITIKRIPVNPWGIFLGIAFFVVAAMGLFLYSILTDPLNLDPNNPTFGFGSYALLLAFISGPICICILDCFLKVANGFEIEIEDENTLPTTQDTP